MDDAISTSDDSSSDTTNGPSSPTASLAASLAAASLETEEGRSTSQGRRGVKTTSFDKVFIYEFPLTIGNNPAVREGCPVSMGTECIHESVLDLEAYEESKRPNIQKQKRGKDLYIPVYDRAALLMSQGFTIEKIVATVLEVERIKKSRQECMKLNGWQKLNFAIDSAGKSIIRKLTNGNSGKTKWNSDKPGTDLRSDSESLKGTKDQKVARMA